MQTPTSLNTLELFGMEARALINELEETFPAFNPQPNDPVNLIMYKSGQRSVIEYIKHKLDEN